MDAADDQLGLLTPALTNHGFNDAVGARQVLVGFGYGYVGDCGLSQCGRATRIAMIYKDADDIQALIAPAFLAAVDGLNGQTAIPR